MHLSKVKKLNKQSAFPKIIFVPNFAPFPSIEHTTPIEDNKSY